MDVFLPIIINFPSKTSKFGKIPCCVKRFSIQKPKEPKRDLVGVPVFQIIHSQIGLCVPRNLLLVLTENT